MYKLHKYVRRFHMKYFPNVVNTAYVYSVCRRRRGFGWVSRLCGIAHGIAFWNSGAETPFAKHPFGFGCCLRVPRVRVPAKRRASRGKFEGSHGTFVGYCLAVRVRLCNNAPIRDRHTTVVVVTVVAAVCSTSAVVDGERHGTPSGRPANVSPNSHTLHYARVLL